MQLISVRYRFDFVTTSSPPPHALQHLFSHTRSGCWLDLEIIIIFASYCSCALKGSTDMASSSPHGIKLAVHLLSAYFGEIVSKVGESLLNKGTLSLAQVVRFTELTKQKVTNSLLVLIQHNCVQAFAIQQAGGFGEPPKIVTQYMALHNNIIHHMRFPKFLSMLPSDFDEDCKKIIEGLLQHGRLSLNQVRDRHKGKHKALVTSEGNGNATNMLHENFNRLAQARFIERCPAHEPFLERPEEGAKKRVAKSKLADVTQTLEARALAAAAPMESQRFLVEADTWSNGALDDDSKKSPTKEVVGEKRKQDSLEPETETWATNKNKEVLWRVNFEEFVLRLRHKSCVSHVTTRVDSAAGIVLSAIFAASRKDETKVKAENTVPMSLCTRLTMKVSSARLNGAVNIVRKPILFPPMISVKGRSAT
ncbi:hypothetical protein QVD17_32177 [Tagetes erecta]|uniref:DNA-directed RNA polymerase III subunit RPC3 n=1 Tax=Tagetes erecta TaxID=13708 RepID=A0AAD8NPW7_TARER|nr:hypothetical protein QVD17_32177 [Tagetes erecta]